MSNYELAVSIFKRNKFRIKNALEVDKILFDNELDCKLVRSVSRELAAVINELLNLESEIVQSIELDINGEYRSIYFLIDELSLESVKELAEKHY